MAVETPNGIEFSPAAKAYICADRLVQPAGMYFGYPTPRGVKVDNRSLSKGIVLITIQSLEEGGTIQLWQEERRQLLGSFTHVMVRALYSGAPGFSAGFLLATGWQDESLVTMLMKLFPRDQAPFIPFLDSVSNEFADAGILTRGGYGAHGNVWDTAWLAHLSEALYPEVYDVWMRAHARPDADVIKRNVMLAVGAKQYTEHDIDD
jgi:hypothetical protein